jgi:hypothetical protein
MDERGNHFGYGGRTVIAQVVGVVVSDLFVALNGRKPGEGT